MWDYQIAKLRRRSVVAIPTQSTLLNLSHYRIIASLYISHRSCLPTSIILDLAKINKQKGMVTHYYLYFC